MAVGARGVTRGGWASSSEAVDNSRRASWAHWRRLSPSVPAASLSGRNPSRLDPGECSPGSTYPVLLPPASRAAWDGGGQRMATVSPASVAAWVASGTALLLQPALPSECVGCAVCGLLPCRAVACARIRAISEGSTVTGRPPPGRHGRCSPGKVWPWGALDDKCHHGATQPSASPWPSAAWMAERLQAP